MSLLVCAARLRGDKFDFTFQSIDSVTPKPMTLEVHAGNAQAVRSPEITPSSVVDHADTPATSPKPPLAASDGPHDARASPESPSRVSAQTAHSRPGDAASAAAAAPAVAVADGSTATDDGAWTSSDASRKSARRTFKRAKLRATAGASPSHRRRSHAGRWAPRHLCRHHSADNQKD